jgi:hypothetical protein
MVAHLGRHEIRGHVLHLHARRASKAAQVLFHLLPDGLKILGRVLIFDARPRVGVQLERNINIS